MTHGLHDLARHNGWANAHLLGYCRRLDVEALDRTVPGTFGTILQTLRHTVSAEASYVFRLTGAWADHPWRGDSEVGLDVLVERASLLATTLEDYLANEWDSERLSEAHGDDGLFSVRSGVILAQLFHHGSEHRAQVCSILGALGHEPPDVSAWGYAVATRRMTLQPETPA